MMNWDYATVIFEQSAPAVAAPYRVSTTAITIPGLDIDREGHPTTRNVKGVVDTLTGEGWEVLFTVAYGNRQHFYLKRRRGSMVRRPEAAHMVPA
jgi:hypothetical protein